MHEPAIKQMIGPRRVKQKDKAAATRGVSARARLFLQSRRQRILGDLGSRLLVRYPDSQGGPAVLLLLKRLDALVPAREDGQDEGRLTPHDGALELEAVTSDVGGSDRDHALLTRKGERRRVGKIE